MHEWASLTDVRWECKYHVVIIPKYRRRVLYGKPKHPIGGVAGTVSPEEPGIARRAQYAGSYPHVREHPAKVQCGSCPWILDPQPYATLDTLVSVDHGELRATGPRQPGSDASCEAKTGWLRTRADNLTHKERNIDETYFLLVCSVALPRLKRALIFIRSLRVDAGRGSSSTYNAHGKRDYR